MNILNLILTLPYIAIAIVSIYYLHFLRRKTARTHIKHARTEPHIRPKEPHEDHENTLKEDSKEDSEEDGLLSEGDLFFPEEE